MFGRKWLIIEYLVYRNHKYVWLWNVLCTVIINVDICSSNIVRHISWKTLRLCSLEGWQWVFCWVKVPQDDQQQVATICVTRPAPAAPAMSCIVLQSSRHLIHLSTICPSLCPSVTGGSCMFLHATYKTEHNRARVSSATIQTSPISHQISPSSAWFCLQ